MAGLLAGLASCAGACAADLEHARAELHAGYAAKLAELAAWCNGQGLADEARRLGSWLPERPADKLTLFAQPEVATAADEGAAEAWPEWRRRWQKLREAQSESLVELARRAAAAGGVALAWEMTMEALRENPDNAVARRALGYVPYRGGWQTRRATRQLGAGRVWHERFGWLPKAHVERYERGERYYGGRWMPAEEEVGLRSDIRRGWRVESEHFAVTTNHSLEEGVALARRLEVLYGAWQQAFAGFALGQAEVERRLAGRPQRREAPLHEVVYFRSRGEYNAALGPQQPKIEMTLGIYLSRARRAYFFAGREQDPGTVWHEATHQLFWESPGAGIDLAGRENFWAVEGVACYLETLEDHGDYCTLGGANGGRTPAARHRLLTDGFYVPLSELVALDMQRLQADPRIAMLYSQSAGLADFFVHAGGGTYREPFVGYLRSIYAGRSNAGSLAEACGASLPELDRAYRQFMAAGQPAQATTGTQAE